MSWGHEKQTPGNLMGTESRCTMAAVCNIVLGAFQPIIVCVRRSDPETRAWLKLSDAQSVIPAPATPSCLGSCWISFPGPTLDLWICNPEDRAWHECLHKTWCPGTLTARMGTPNLHFERFPRRCWCWRSGEHTLRTTALDTRTRNQDIGQENRFLSS